MVQNDNNNNKEQVRRRPIIIRGIAKWAKVTGKPSPGYKDQFNHWSLDVYVDDETVDRLKTEGLGPKIKNKGEGNFVAFSRKEFKGDGSPNTLIRIVDAKGDLLQGQDRQGVVKNYSGPKIGNGSTVNVNFAINEYGKNEKSMNILSLQVWDLIPYEGGEFPTKVDPEGSWTEDAA